MYRLLNERSSASRFDRLYKHFPRMREVFRGEANRILNGSIQMEHELKDRRIGVEIELSCLTDDGVPITEDLRNLILESSVSLHPELGAAQIEVITDPITVTASNGFSALHAAMRDANAWVESHLASFRAKPIRIGSNPFVAPDDSCRTLTLPRYTIVPHFHDRHRRFIPDTVFTDDQKRVQVRDAGVVGAFSSVQANIDCTTHADALQMLNQGLMTVPYALALAGNASHVGGVDTGWTDVRGYLWEQTHDIRTPREVMRGMPTRVGLPHDYFATLTDYFRDVHNQPSPIDMLDRAFDLGIGMYWRDARLKFLRRGEDSAQIVMEFRPLSLQPTVEEDYAMVAFTVGHIFGLRVRNTPLLPMWYVKDNRMRAMYAGLQGTLWAWKSGRAQEMPAIEAVSRAVRVASDGLSHLGMSQDELEVVMGCWKKNLVHGCPAERLRNLLRSKGGDASQQLLEIVGNAW